MSTDRAARPDAREVAHAQVMRQMSCERWCSLDDDPDSGPGRTHTQMCNAWTAIIEADREQRDREHEAELADLNSRNERLFVETCSLTARVTAVEAERDALRGAWEALTPAAPLPDSGMKKLAAGQIWLTKYPVGPGPEQIGAVFRVDEEPNSDGVAAATLLASTEGTLVFEGYVCDGSTAMRHAIPVGVGEAASLRERLAGALEHVRRMSVVRFDSGEEKCPCCGNELELCDEERDETCPGYMGRAFLAGAQSTAVTGPGAEATIRTKVVEEVIAAWRCGELDIDDPEDYLRAVIAPSPPGTPGGEPSK